MTGVEGYPGLVVHGPLLALFLLEVPRRHHPAEPVERVELRLRRPAFVGYPIATHAARAVDENGGTRVDLEAAVPGDPASITGRATLGNVVATSSRVVDREPSLEEASTPSGECVALLAEGLRSRRMSGELVDADSRLGLLDQTWWPTDLDDLGAGVDMESDEGGGPDTATVDLLRRAADELERLRHRLPPGRWVTRGLLATRPEILAEDAAGQTEHVAEARQRSARWILAMSPAVALPIIAWLRETAEVLERPRPGVTASTAAATALASELLERLGPPA